jgi:two-component system, chemotaxis family, protein-glutamate methylesterase/glutaminase
MRTEKFLRRFKEQGIEVVVIGTSAGGVEALREILPSFKTPLALCVMVVIHLPPEGPNLIPTLYQEFCDYKVKEADSGENLIPGTIYIAAPNYHLSLEKNKSLSLSVESPLNYSRPSIDILFESAAYAFGNKCMGILLTGANADGARGLETIHRRLGLCLVQDPEDAEYSSMPEAAIGLFEPDLILKLEDIKKLLVTLSAEKV